MRAHLGAFWWVWQAAPLASEERRSARSKGCGLNPFAPVLLGRPGDRSARGPSSPTTQGEAQNSLQRTRPPVRRTIKAGFSSL